MFFHGVVPPLVDKCPLCGGKKVEGQNFTVDLKETLVVVRDVPATLCSLCGNEWLADDIASVLEAIVQEAKNKRHSFEVTRYGALAG